MDLSEPFKYGFLVGFILLVISNSRSERGPLACDGVGGARRRTALGNVWDYSLTSAGEDLRPIIMALGHWGAQWIGTRLRKNELDPGLLMWDVRRSVHIEEFPSECVVIHFRFCVRARVNGNGGSWWRWVTQSP